MTTLTADAPAARGRRPGHRGTVRRIGLPLAGVALALVFLGPYIVMLLDALRPSADVRSSSI